MVLQPAGTIFGVNETLLQLGTCDAPETGLPILFTSVIL